PDRQPDAGRPVLPEPVEEVRRLARPGPDVALVVEQRDLRAVLVARRQGVLRPARRGTRAGHAPRPPPQRPVVTTIEVPGDPVAWEFLQANLVPKAEIARRLGIDPANI